MPESELKITVLMPVFDQKEKYLAEAIESILAQTYENFEFLIINDGSVSVGCNDLLRSYAKKDSRINLVNNQKNIGLTKTLNKGLQMAKGEFIARMDSDDVSEKERLEKQLRFMEKNPEIMLCGSWVNFIDEDGNRLGSSKPAQDHEQIKKIILKGNIFTHSTWFFRKNLVEKMGLYAEDAIKAEDYDFLLRIVPKYRIANIPEFLCRYRINMDSISFKNNKIQEFNALKVRWKALKEYGYPKRGYFALFRPLLIFMLVPFFVKKRLYKYIWEN